MIVVPKSRASPLKNSDEQDQSLNTTAVSITNNKFYNFFRKIKYKKNTQAKLPAKKHQYILIFPLLVILTISIETTFKYIWNYTGDSEYINYGIRPGRLFPQDRPHFANDWIDKMLTDLEEIDERNHYDQFYHKWIRDFYENFKKKKTEKEETGNQSEIIKDNYSRCILEKAGTLATQGYFNEKKEYKYTGPCYKANLIKWYDSNTSICEVLSKFTIHTVGASCERRIMHTLQDQIWNTIPGLFRKSMQAPQNRTQLLFDDRKGVRVYNRKLRNKLPKNVTVEQFVEARDCFKFFHYHEASMRSVLKRVANIIKTLPKVYERRRIVFFSYALGHVSNGRKATDYWRYYDLAQHARTLQNFIKKYKPLADEKDVILMWRAPPPVNHKNDRFSVYRAPTTINVLLNRWHKLTTEVAHVNGICSINTFDPIMQGYTIPDTIEHETGLEWNPPQYGGIHLTDTGRLLVANLFINQLNICEKQMVEYTRQRELLFSTSKDDGDDDNNVSK